jgi:hypothetical protein
MAITRDRAPQPKRRDSHTDVLLVGGIVASVLYAATTVLAAMRWESYSNADQTVSELFAVDAPSRSLVVPLLLAYDVLMIGFGIGVVRSAPGKRGLRVAGGLTVVYAAVGLAGPFLPIHLRGTDPTLTDTMHLVLTGVLVLLMVMSIGFGAFAQGSGFRLYSLLTLVTLAVFGALAGMQGPRVDANEPTPWLGVYERINIGVYLVWVAVLAAARLRDRASVFQGK